MQDYKFRGLTKEGKEVKGYYFKNSEDRHFIMLNHSGHLSHDIYEVLPETVGMFTGLLDKTKWEELEPEEQQHWLSSGRTKKEWNGKEIYEGDCPGGNFEGFHVGWCDEQGGWELFTLENECMACEGDIHWYEFIEDPNREIIGSIPQNLEVKP